MELLIVPLRLTRVIGYELTYSNTLNRERFDDNEKIS